MIGPVVRLTLRALLLQKRTLLLAAVALLPVVMAFVFEPRCHISVDPIGVLSP